MKARDVERYWERVNELLDPTFKREKPTMKIYGQAATDPLVFASDLSVDCDCPDAVQMTTHIGYVSFLAPQEVEELIIQLSDWLLTRTIGEEK